MERALTLWTHGEDPSYKLQDGTKSKASLPSFAELEWGAKARGWCKSAEGLSEEDWEQIYSVAHEKLPTDAAAGDEALDGPDPRSLIEL